MPSLGDKIRQVLRMTTVMLDRQPEITVERAIQLSVKEMKLHWGYVPWAKQAILQQVQLQGLYQQEQEWRQLSGTPAREFAQRVIRLAIDSREAS